MPVRKTQDISATRATLKVLAVSPQPSGINGLSSALQKATNMRPQIATANLKSAANALRKDTYDLIVIEDQPPESDALELLSQMRKGIAVVLGANENWSRVMDLLTSGAAEVVTPQQAAGGMLTFALRRALGRPRRGVQKDSEAQKERQTDAAMRERYKQLRQALKNSPVSVWFQDLDLKYVWIYNPTPPVTNLRDVIGKTDEEIFGAEVARPLMEVKRRALEDGIKIDQNLSLTFNGLTTHHALSVEPARDETGKITGLICTATDISSAHRADEELALASSKLSDVSQRLERNARQREGILRALRKQAELLDLAQDAILVCDDEDRILYWNHGAEETYGWKSNEAVGMIAYELLMTRFPIPFEQLKATLLKDHTYMAELEHTTRDGRRIIVASRWAVRSNNGSEVSFLQINRDITERKRTEEDLKESEERFRAIFSESSIGIILEDTHGKIIDANPAIQKMLGWDLDEMRKLGVAGITHPDDSISSMKLLAELESGSRGRQSIEKRYVRKHGGHIWGSVTLFGIRDVRGKLRYVTAMIEDITLRKQAEEKLLEASEQRRLALEGADLGTWDYALQSGEVLWDERCRALFGVPDVDSLKYEKVLSLIHPDDRAIVNRALVEAANPSSDGRYEIEFRVVWPWDDTVHWLLGKGQAYFEGKGRKWQAVRLVGTFMDVGARKAAEEQIRHHNEHLSQLIEERARQIEKLERQKLESDKQVAVGRMAARLAHEINNPLAGVGMSFRLVKKALPAEHPNNEYAERIERELERIARIVRQMFELYRPEHHEPDVFNPVDAIREIVSLLEKNLQTQRVTLELDTDDANRLVVLHLDSLKQVVFNLMQNAIEASPPDSKIYVHAAVKDNRLELSVADMGEGIPESAHDHVFEPFFTTKDYLTTGGLGLGLSIARSIVEASGGTITFENGAKGGTVFHVVFPVQVKE